MSLKVVSTEAYPILIMSSICTETWYGRNLAWISLTTLLACCIPLSLVLDVISTGASLNWTTSTREAMDGDLDGKSKGERQQRTGRIIKGVGDRHAASDGRRPTSLGVPRSSGVHRPPGSRSAIKGSAIRPPCLGGVPHSSDALWAPGHGSAVYGLAQCPAAPTTARAPR